MAIELDRPRNFGLESGILISKIEALPDENIIRGVASITRASEAAQEFMHGYGVSFRRTPALKLLELGLPETIDRPAMNAELFWGAAIKTVLHGTDETVKTADLVSSLATRSPRNAMAGVSADPNYYLGRSSDFETIFGKPNVRAGLLNATRVVMAGKIGILGSSVRNREDFFAPAGVAAAAWIQGDARNPIARLVFDRNPKEIKQIDDGVKDLLAAVPARKVEEIVRGRVNAPVRPEMLVYWAAQWLHRDQSAVDHMPKQSHDGNVQPTDIFFAELSNDMQCIANHPL